ncbi:MAG TPA: hypothetical protein PK047_04880 [Saprospiraceae bacterium]|nr:hypothetical protein [Saprospiraceae bacterium]HRO08179.1 hypothetical protein [Saprospiraceae bacterium]HRP41572.1 hypothetical protein [Saprospiraceae bacterium]
MSLETQNSPKKGDEEVDIIRLFEYFKQGFNSIFKSIGKLFNYFIRFIVLLKKNWIIIGGLTLLGGIYGGIIKPLIEGSEIKYYEMIVRSGANSNLELYAFASEVKNQKASSANKNSEGIQLAKELGIVSLLPEPLKRDEDVIANYFEQIESNKLRGLETDTLFFRDYKLKEHKLKMADTDYPVQKLKIMAKNTDHLPKNIQEKLLAYFNNLNGVKADQNVRITVLTNYEKEIKQAINNIDSILAARIQANKQDIATSNNQMVLNAASRENVEKDMLRSYETYTKKLYGIQKDIALYTNPVNIVSNLRSAKEESVIINPTINYMLYGFIFSTLVVLGIQFNKYLNRFASKNNM